jgi:hypothetical protein
MSVLPILSVSCLIDLHAIVFDQDIAFAGQMERHRTGSPVERSINRALTPSSQSSTDG